MASKHAMVIQEISVRFPPSRPYAQCLLPGPWQPALFGPEGCETYDSVSPLGSDSRPARLHSRSRGLSSAVGPELEAEAFLARHAHRECAPEDESSWAVVRSEEVSASVDAHHVVEVADMASSRRLQCWPTSSASTCPSGKDINRQASDYLIRDTTKTSIARGLRLWGSSVS